ncbi:MAG: AsmA family protein, partial [bacterium]
MKLKSVIGWTIAVAVVLLLVIAALVKLFYGPDKIVETLVPHLEETFQRQVEYGDVEFTVFTGIGVRLHDVRVKNDPGFDRENFLTIDHLDCTVRLPSLMRGKIEFARLILHQPELYLIKNVDGETNYNVADTTIGAPGDGQALEALLDFDEFVIRDGRVIWRFDSAGVKVAVGRIDYRGRLFGKERQVLEGRLEVDSLLLSTEIEDLQIYPAQLGAEFSFLYYTGGDSVRVEFCNLTAADLKARLQGRILDFSTSPNVDLALMAPRVRLENLENSALFAPMTFLRDVELRGDLRLDAAYKGLFADPRADNLRGKLTLTDFQAKARRLDTEIEIKLAELNFNSRSISFYTEDATIGDAPAACRLAVDNFGDLNLSAELRFNAEAEVLGKLFQLESASDLGGRVEVDLSGFARLRERENLRLLGSVMFDQLSGPLPGLPYPVESLNLSCQLLGRDLQIQNLGLRCGESEFHVTGKINGFTPWLASGGEPETRPFFEFSLTGDNLDFNLLTATPQTEESDTLTALPLVARFPLFDGGGTFYCENALFAGFPLQELYGRLTLLSRVLHLDSLTADIYGGRATGEAIFDYSGEGSPEWELQVSAQDFEINSLLQRCTGFGDHLFGATRMLAEFKGVGTSEADILTSLDAAGSLTMMQGRLSRFTTRERVKRELGFDLVPRESISDLTAGFAIGDLELYFSELDFTSDRERYGLEGRVGFDSNLDLRVTGVVSGDDARLLDIAEDTRRQIRSLGFGEVELSLKGPAEDPAIEILSARAGRGR